MFLVLPILVEFTSFSSFFMPLMVEVFAKGFRIRYIRLSSDGLADFRTIEREFLVEVDIVLRDYIVI